MKHFFFHVGTDFFEHPKTFKLRRELGDGGVASLLRLWAWAAEQRPNGNLSGLDDEDIEYAAHWSGGAGEFAAALARLRWLDGEPGRYTLHGWDEHNADPAGAQGRAGQNRLRSLARYHPEAYKQLKAKGVTGLSASEYAALTSGGAGLPAAGEEEPEDEEDGEGGPAKIAAALAKVLDPSARGEPDDQSRAAAALRVFPHAPGGRKPSLAAAVEWAARMKARYPKIRLELAVQDAALAVSQQGAKVKDPIKFMERWLKRMTNEEEH